MSLMRGLGAITPETPQRYRVPSRGTRLQALLRSLRPWTSRAQVVGDKHSELSGRLVRRTVQGLLQLDIGLQEFRLVSQDQLRVQDETIRFSVAARNGSSPGTSRRLSGLMRDLVFFRSP